MTDLSHELVHQRLQNWCNWAKDRPHYRITPSLEGRYKPPPCWHPPEARIFVDLNDAYKVESAIIKIPDKFKNIIIYAYIKKYLKFEMVCRKLHISQSDYPIQEKKAINMVKNRLIAIDNLHII